MIKGIVRQIGIAVLGVACLCLLAGCGAGKINPVNLDISIPEKNVFEDIQNFSQQGELKFKFVPMYDEPGFSSDFGYYHMVSNRDASRVVYFVDYESDKQMPICSRPECKHKDQSCTAWFAYGGGVMLPIPVGNKIVFIGGGKPGSDITTLGNVMIGRIESMDLDGANRKINYVFDRYTQINFGLGDVRNGFAIDDQNLYFAAETYYKQEEEVKVGRILCAYNTLSEKVFLLKEIDIETRIVGAFEHYLVIENSKGMAEVSGDMTKVKSKLFLLNLQDFSETEVGSHPYLEQALCDGDMAYFLTETGDLNKIALRTGETTTVAQGIITPENFDRMEPYEIYDGKMYIAYHKTIQEPRFIRILMGIDLATGETKEFNRFYELEDYDHCYLIVDASPNQYLVKVGEKNERVVEIPVDRENAVHFPYTDSQYALQSKEDFWNEADTLRPVTDIS